MRPPRHFAAGDIPPRLDRMGSDSAGRNSLASAYSLLSLVEPGGDQILDGSRCLSLVFPLDDDLQGRAVGSREQKNSEDRFSVNLLVVFANSHRRSKTA